MKLPLPAANTTGQWSSPSYIGDHRRADHACGNVISQPPVLPSFRNSSSDLLDRVALVGKEKRGWFVAVSREFVSHCGIPHEPLMLQGAHHQHRFPEGPCRFVVTHLLGGGKEKETL